MPQLQKTVVKMDRPSGETGEENWQYRHCSAIAKEENETKGKGEMVSRLLPVQHTGELLNSPPRRLPPAI